MANSTKREVWLRYRLYLNQNPHAPIHGYTEGDHCRPVAVGKVLASNGTDKNLDEIFRRHNEGHHRHRSASVGDVIVIGKEVYGIERLGFRKVGYFRQRERNNMLGPSL